MNTIYLSQQGYDDLKAELNQLKSVERPKIINQIAEARDKGDLSENAEYDAAKEAQGLLEARIAKLESDVSIARVLDESEMDTSTAHLLTKVTIKNTVNGEEFNHKCDGVFLGIGHKPNSDLFKDSLDLDVSGYIKTKADSTETSIQGVYAAGDIQDHVYRQAVTAAGSGCMAAIEVERFLES